ncbi:MAG TPA: hypothetical protein VER11_29835, partial [Polyangiaceae bacterium]|nr:hypothetical protein [Polyangiaceae bacterium]
VNISASAAAGMANLARGGRGGTSLPPERAGGPRRSGKPAPATHSWSWALLLMIIVVGGLSAALGYLMRSR